MEAGFTNSVGERPIDIFLRRHKRGIRVDVKVWPDVEDFFKRWGGGVTEAPMAAGRLWQPLSGDKPTVWSLETRLPVDVEYSLIHTGGPLVTLDGQVNLSIIRLVGATEGRSIIFENVIGRSELERISQKMSRAAANFYMEFLHPVHLNVFVGVRDLRGAQDGTGTL